MTTDNHQSCTCGACGNEHQPQTPVDMTGHDEAVRQLVQEFAGESAAILAAVQSALDGDIPKEPRRVKGWGYPFVKRYYPDYHYVVWVGGRLMACGVGQKNKVLWSAWAEDQAAAS